jgi:outer membrane protein OmpU
MDKLKKLGLTALAGSLVATSAYAGTLDVTGGASIKYVSEDETDVTGQPFTMGRGITFTGTGDVNGNDVKFFYIMDDAAYSSSGLSVDMGDNGKFTFENGGQNTGLMSLKDKIPVAGAEQAYDDMDGDGNGLASMANEGVLGWANTYSGVNVSLAFNKGGDSSTGGETSTQAGTSKSIAISGEVSEGLEAGIGYGDISGATTAADETQTTVYAKYAVGGVTLALQRTDLDKPSNTKDIESMGYGVTFQVNPDLAIGVSRLDVDFDNAASVEQESSAFGASYTMGSMAVKGTMANTDAAGGVQGADDKHTEIVLSFNF